MNSLKHARLAPSSAHRWLACPGSVVLEDGLPDTESVYSRDGTAAHELAEGCFKEGHDPAHYLGRPMSNGVTVDQEMAEGVQAYRTTVRALAGDDPVWREQRLDLRAWIPHSFGTADAVILKAEELIVCDLKMGRGVKVDAFENSQLICYLLGAYRIFECLSPIRRVRGVIIQPPLDHIDEWGCDLDMLLQHGERIKAGAHYAQRLIEGATLADDDFAPSESTCRFCRAKGCCLAQAQFVFNTIADDFVDLTRPLDPPLQAAQERIQVADNRHIASLLPHLGLIEQWCDAVRRRAEHELLEGQEVPGYKLVEGQRGKRGWVDESAAATALLASGLPPDELYARKLISPMGAERRLKKSRPQQWKQLQPLITRPDGAPYLVPVSDPRPPLPPAAHAVRDAFEVLEACTET